jgi:hypothetical protein
MSNSVPLLDRVCSTAQENMRQHPHAFICPICNSLSDIREISKTFYQITFSVEVKFDYHSMRHIVKKLTFLCDCYNFYPCGKRSEWLEIVNNIKQEYRQSCLDVYVEDQDKETGHSRIHQDRFLSEGRI